MQNEDVSRREFLGSATLTTAGVAAGLSFYFSRPKRQDLSMYKRPANQVKLGYIGVGNRGGALLRSSLQVPGNIPIAVADLRAEQRKDALNAIQAAKKRDDGIESYEVKLHDDYRRVLDNKDIEAVFIATPHYLHGTMALDALEAGKHVYCEKAMAFTIGENQDLHRFVQSLPNRVFQVGHQRHYSRLYRKVKDMVDQGVIGDIAAIRAQWNMHDEVRRPCPNPEMEKVINWRLYSEFSGGLTTEFASHQIDVANWMLGTHPDSVCGFGGCDWYLDGRDTHDNIHLIFNYRVPVPDRDAYGRLQKDSKNNVLYKKEGGRTVYRNVRFTYNCIMQNELLKASELLLGTDGSIEVSLQGGEFYKEAKARQDPNRIAEGTNPNRPLQKKILKTGSTVNPNAASIQRPKGEPVDAERNSVTKSHWVEFTEPIQGSYDNQETMLAIGSFLEAIRLARQGKDFKDELKADVDVGLWGAVPALMANIAMREQRTVYWSEFFPKDETASVNPHRLKPL